MKQIFRKRFLFGSILGIFFIGIFLWIFFREQNSYVAPLDQPVVTVINQIRGRELGLEHTDMLASLQGQYSATTRENIVATWLWQYSAMEDPVLTAFAKEQMKGQEFGIFLEIDRNTAAKSGVVYRGQGPWYFSDGLFLNGYDIGERKKLIDTIFARFKQTFGFYPKTVGAWWVGADSLRYMHDRYGVIAFLQCSDQYAVDAYTIWGTPWSIPYISSKENAAAPARSFEASSGVVTMQWSARDPTYGYGNSGKYSTYSMQDFGLKKYDFDYFDYLFSIFLHKPGDQLVIGLEGGFLPESYQQDYLKRLQRAKWLQKEENFIFMTAGDFAEGFLARKDVFGGTRYFLSNAFDSDTQSFWFHSEAYRAAILKQDKNIFLIDLRDYMKEIPEEFIFLPNSQGHLRVVPDVVIDSAHLPQQKLLLATTDTPLTVQENGETVLLKTGDTEIAFFTKDAMNLLTLKKAYTFTSDTVVFDIPLFLFSLLVIYAIFLRKQLTTRKLIFYGILFLSALFIAKPYLSNGTLNSLHLIFDQKQLLFFSILPFIPLSFPLNVMVIFQLLPFIILLMTHYFFVVKKKREVVFAIFMLLFLLLYIHVPSGIVTAFITRKTMFVLGVLGLFIFFSVITLSLLVRKRQMTLIKKILSLLIVGGVFFGVILLFSWQKFVITPFEKAALTEISSLHKPVLLIEPKTPPLYRAVKPLLFQYLWVGEKLTNVPWEKITRPNQGFLEIANTKKRLIVVPRYLGSELYPEERDRYNLKKIFDNGQIELYDR